MSVLNAYTFTADWTYKYIATKLSIFNGIRVHAIRPEWIFLSEGEAFSARMNLSTRPIGSEGKIGKSGR
jgi:hypothetical protein